MKKEKKGNQKHLTLSQRIQIEKGLNDHLTFAEIVRRINKDPSTISKEVRRHQEQRVRKNDSLAIPCANRSSCKMRYLCSEICPILCKICRKPDFRCSEVCIDYMPIQCQKLNKAPYICNGCSKRTNCLLSKSIYVAKYAYDKYRDDLISSREGINQTAVDIAMLDELISPLLRKGQSIAHIYSNHAGEINCCRKTLYNYIDKSVFTARNIDLRHRVRYKPRRKATQRSILTREYRIGRTYDDFQKMLKESALTSVVEMDTVEGVKGGKVLLTMMFRNCSLMLLFLMDAKTQENVNKIFDNLTEVLGIQIFQLLFQVILTDYPEEKTMPKFCCNHCRCL